MRAGGCVGADPPAPGGLSEADETLRRLSGSCSNFHYQIRELSFDCFVCKNLKQKF